MVKPAILVRLSREDLKTPGAPEEKAARHLAIAVELAAQRGLPPVPQEDIYTESGVSGRKLSKRPDTLRLLDRCRTGYYTHVVTAYQSRVLRGDKRDEADIEDAFLDGQITLITTEGEIRFDETYEASNALVFEIRAAADRNYVRDIIKKLRESNRQRALLGTRSGGMAPFGYYWQTARNDQRRIIDPAHYEIVGDLTLTDRAAALAYARAHLREALEGDDLLPGVYVEKARRIGQQDGSLLPGVECTGGEYAVLTEIFTRIRREGFAPIVRSLNERRVPTPGSTRFRAGFAASVWHDSTVRTIVNNLHHSGFPAHTTTRDRRGRRIKLPADRQILPTEEQRYPHPIRLPDHRALLELINNRCQPGSARPRSLTLLTGLLRCAHDQPCRSNSTAYECRCYLQGAPHLGESLAKEVANRAALHVLRASFDSLPADLPTAASRQVSEASTALIRLDREMSAKRRELEDLRRHAATFARAGNTDAFEAAIRALGQEIEQMQQNLTAIQADTRDEKRRQALSAIEQLRQLDFGDFWAEADIREKRAIVRLVIEKMAIIPQAARGRHVTHLEIQVQPWIRPFYDPVRLALREVPSAPKSIL